MTFTEGRANVGIQLDDEALFAAPATAPLEAQIDPASGTITGGQLQVPQFFTHITAPIDADVAVDFNIGEISGSYSQATGALTLSGMAGGTLRAGDGAGGAEECEVSVPEVLTLTSATPASEEGSPRAGASFSHGLTGPGAIGGEWEDMIAEPVSDAGISFCNNVENQIGGAGGVWLQQQGDIVPPAAPQLLGTDPASPAASARPRVLGAAEAGSRVRLYAGPGCAGAPIATRTAERLASPGIAVQVAEGVTASFSATATDAADNTSACSAPISYTHLQAVTLVPPPPPKCVVPKLAGKRLKAAKKKIRAAGCRVGKVTKPKPRKRGKKAKRRGPFVVKSSGPAAGRTVKAGTKVNLRLGPKPQKRTRR